MNLQTLFEVVESVEFAINFSVLSGFQMFQDALSDNETLQAFVAHLNKYPGQKQKIVDRIIELTDKDVDASFQHPDDIALAVYLYVLSKVDLTSAFSASQCVINLENLWWSKRIATSVIDSMETKQDSVFIRSKVTLYPASSSRSVARNVYKNEQAELVEALVFQGKAS